MRKNLNIIIAAVITATLVILAIWWRVGSGSIVVEPRVPGLDNQPDSGVVLIDVTIGEFFERFAEENTSSVNNWPRFRGADYTNISRDKTPLAESWPTEGPRVVWQHSLGEGHAAPVIMNGRVYLLDYNEEIKADMLRCFSLKTGKELWRRWYSVPLKRNHGMSRTIPAVTEKYLISIGPRGHIMCLEPVSGDLLWTLDLEKEYGAETPFWYTGQCPIIIDDVAIFAPGGDKLMIGVDCNTGSIIWEAPNEKGIKMSHSSIMPINLLGKDMLVYNGVGGIAGVGYKGQDTGKVFWVNTEWSPAVIAPSPVKIKENEIVVLAGYGAGGGVISIARQGDSYSATLVKKHTPREGIASEQQTPVLSGEYLWTILPKDAGILRNQLVCYHITDLVNPVWASGKEERFGLGPFIVAGDRMFLLNDDGELSMFRFNGKSVTLMARYKVIDGIDAWGPFALADGYLLMRDSHNVLCIDVGKR